MNKFWYICLAGALLLSAAACERRPLEEPVSAVDIQVDINVEAVANVTTSVYNSHIPVPSLHPEMMRVLIYDPETRDLISQSFLSAQSVDSVGNQVLSGHLSITYGTFDILVYNFDTPNVHVSGENNENTILAYTEEIPTAERLHYAPETRSSDTDSDSGSDTKSDTKDGESVVYNYEPDHFIVAREHNLRVSPRDTVVVIKTFAHTIIDTYYIQIHVTGLQYASSATAVITGLSPSNYFGLDERTESPVAAVGFDLRKSRDENWPGENKEVLCALFNTFGKIPNATSDLRVTFNVIDTSGQLQQKECNLDEVFETEDAKERHWLLVNEVFEIKKPDDPSPGQEGGFQPMVGDWDQVDSEIEL